MYFMCLVNTTYKFVHLNTFTLVQGIILLYTFNLTENDEHFVLSNGWNKRRKEKKKKLNKIQQRRMDERF